MATPSNSQSTSRWERGGDSGGAFNGLGRPGRGRGRGGHRGGRGGGRGNHSGRESRQSQTEDASRPAKADAPTSGGVSPSVSTAARPQPAAIKVSNSSDKSTSAGASSPVKAKTTSRKASRAGPPPTVNTQVPPASGPSSSPSTARPANQRKRSQNGKSNATVPPKIAPPAPNDTLAHPIKAQLSPAPHTAPIKDTPPHLNQRSDMRQDIEALVERVRASAMDHRPATPGSHIDWAGDDDDSLPDLDDWGVTTSTFNSTKSETISPIILEGLRPLPDITSSMAASPLRQVITLDSEPLTDRSEKSSHNASPLATSPAGGERKISGNAEATSSDGARVGEVKRNGGQNLLPSKPAQPTEVKPAPRTPLHSSLPPKPSRNSHTKSPVNVKGGPPTRGRKGSNVESATTKQEPNPSVSPSFLPTTVNGQNSSEVTIIEPSSSPAAAPLPTSKTNADVGDKVEGLEASMHAPKAGMSDSISAPANISSYSDLHPSTRDQSYTHTRSHTAPRLPPHPRSANEPTSRFPRGGGRGHAGFHARNHSSPQVSGSQNNGHRPPHARPVLTGDALSRLARTIGKSSVSPKIQTVATLGE